MFQPDDLDRKIIHLFREEEVNNYEAARRIGISEGTVRQRLKRLKAAGILRIRAQINPAVLHDQQLVLLGVNVSESRLLEQKAEELSLLPPVLSVTIASGRYDILMEVLVSSNRGLVDFLTQQLPQVEGISSSESFLQLKSYNKYV